MNSGGGVVHCLFGRESRPPVHSATDKDVHCEHSGGLGSISDPASGFLAAHFSSILRSCSP
jgi:hypothetical protein